MNAGNYPSLSGWFITTSCLFLLGQGMTLGAEPVSRPEGVQEEVVEASPLKVVQAFTLGVLIQDRSLIESSALPHEGLSILWQGEPPPAEVRQAMKTSIEGMTLHQCEAGHEHVLPGGKQLKVEEALIRDGGLVVFPILDGRPSPLPWVLRKMKGDWKVDASPLVMARRRALELRETTHQP